MSGMHWLFLGDVLPVLCGYHSLPSVTLAGFLRSPTVQSDTFLCPSPKEGLDTASFSGGHTDTPRFFLYRMAGCSTPLNIRDSPKRYVTGKPRIQLSRYRTRFGFFSYGTGRSVYRSAVWQSDLTRIREKVKHHKKFFINTPYKNFFIIFLRKIV